MTAPNSYQTILRSSSIIGGAQIVNIVSGILKMKAVALLLGPTGVGFIGLYVNMMQTASAVAALGLGTVGTRQIAAAKAEGGDIALGRVRRSLFWLTLLLALAGGLIFWLLSGWISRLFVLDSNDDKALRWLAFGVALTVGGGFYTALLTGMRHVADLALVSVTASAAAAVFGVAAIWLWGEHGILVLVVITPLATLAFGYIFVARLGSAPGQSEGFAEIARQWPSMIRLGVPLMLSGLVTVFGQLAVRSLVQREIGPEGLGHFQAAWTIGMTYIGFVLGAMATDYYPRLSASIQDREATARLVNEQTEVALLLCAPVLLLMLGLAPWVIALLYSAEFHPAAEVLRWQILGDILKVMSWPLGFLLLARAAGKSFILAESLGIGAFVLVTWIGLPLIGLTATGVGFLAMYFVYLPLVWWLAQRSIGSPWTIAVITQAVFISSAACLILIVSVLSDEIAAILALALSLISAYSAKKRLESMTEYNGKYVQSLSRKFKRPRK